MLSAEDSICKTQSNLYASPFWMLELITFISVGEWRWEMTSFPDGWVECDVIHHWGESQLRSQEKVNVYAPSVTKLKPLSPSVLNLKLRNPEYFIGHILAWFWDPEWGGWGVNGKREQSVTNPKLDELESVSQHGKWKKLVSFHGDVKLKRTHSVRSSNQKQQEGRFRKGIWGHGKWMIWTGISNIRAGNLKNRVIFSNINDWIW